MSKPFQWGQALTALGLVTALGACSGKMAGTNSASSHRIDPSKVGLATRAQAALATNDLVEALAFAESAVEYRPQDAAFRALLGNVYLASGRFASAEATYRDSLTLNGNQPQVVLKLALTQIALGKSDQASGLLASARSMLDPTDLGLALALAGRADQAVAVLEPAARALGADARTRQNLALAYALGGDWDAARTIAAQDIPADQLDGRMDQWLGLAKPGQNGAQIAGLIGVTRAASDPGQPVRLALSAPAPMNRVAAAEPFAPIAPVTPITQIAFAPTAPAPEAIVPYAEGAPVASVEQPAAPQVPEIAVAAAPVAPPAPAAIALRAPRPALTPAAVRLSQSLPELRRAALPRNGRSRAVVQLGAYDKRSYIEGAWNRLSARYGNLRDYMPVTARFDGAKGTLYRLSVKGFASDRDAVRLCASLKRSGANCFVRAAFNDAPVQLASR